MMVQSKIKVKENDENGVATSKRRSSTTEADHWAFLEEIEAPMWADLSLEPKLMTEDQDDSWFHTSHPFHHHSARHLRSAFAHPDVGNDLFNVNLQGACSPQLPPSVSKSRGKDYRNRGWRSNGGQISSSKAHPINDLGDRISILNTASSRECKPKASHANPNDASCSTTSVMDDSKKRAGLNSQPASTNGVSTSTVTTVSLQQDSKVFEVLNEGGGHPGSLLNALRTNLRKSRATRPASRVEISDEGESKGQKYSSGKSSVGPSSAGCDTEAKGSAVMTETDQCKQVKTGQKCSAGKSSVGSSFTGYDTDANGSALTEETDQSKQVKIEQKYSAGKSSVGSSNTGYDTEANRSALTEETDQSKQVVRSCEVQKTSFVRSNKGSSNPKIDVKKAANGGRKNKDRSSNARDLTILGKPVNGTAKDKRTGEASFCARNNAYSSNIRGNDSAAAGTNACSSKIKNDDAATRDNSYSSRIKGSDAAAKIKGRSAAAAKIKGNAAAAKIKGSAAAAATRDNLYNSRRVKGNDAAAKSNSSSSKIKGNLAEAAKNNPYGSKTKSNAVAVKNDSYSSKIMVDAAAAACSSKEASKSKVLLQTTKKNSLNQSKTGIQGAKGKVGSSQSNQLVRSGKENVRGTTILSSRSGGEDTVPVVRVSDQKVPKLKAKIKGGFASIGSKVRTGKVGDGIKVIKPMDTRIHFR